MTGPASPRQNGGNLFNDLPTLTTPRLILRTMSLDDAADMFAYASNPLIARYVVWDAHRTIEDARAYLRCVIEDYREGIPTDWGIEYRENGVFIGTGGFFSWDRDHRRAEIHYALSMDYAGKGLMSEAVREIIRFGFRELSLNRIEGKCMPENNASEHVLIKAGMTFEGIMREGLYAGGKFNDLKMYAIIKNDWLRSRP